MDITAMVKSDACTPPEPKRTAAQSRNGNGIKMSAGVLPRHPPAAPNAKILIDTVPTASKPASAYCEELALRIQDKPFKPNNTTVGTMTSSATMFVKRRALHRAQ